jgi:hypothetical protein
VTKPTVTEKAPLRASNEAEPAEHFDLVEHLRRLRARRAYEKFMALKGKIHININIDELRGRNRR